MSTPDRSGPVDRVVEQARQLAAARGHGIVGTDHLLLALVQGGEGSFARRLLDELGVNETIRARIEAAIGGEGSSPET